MGNLLSSVRWNEEKIDRLIRVFLHAVGRDIMVADTNGDTYDMALDTASLR